MSIRQIDAPITRDQLRGIAQELFGDMVKAVVDIEKGIMAVAGELHADEEAFLIERGSKQDALWGINLYPDKPDESWLEFDSMINIRPSQNNRSRGVEDPAIRDKISQIVNGLIKD